MKLAGNLILNNVLQTTIYLQDTGVTNSYAVDFLPGIDIPTEYTEGFQIYVKISNSNTGASTVNIGDLGAIYIKKNVNQDLIANDLLAGQVVELIYDGTNFQVIGGFGQSVVGGGILLASPYNVEATTGILICSKYNPLAT